MTPDEVVARARELGGQEALLTVRGMVTANDEGWVHVSTNSGALVILSSPARPAYPEIVDIQPAPPRIVAGQLYADDRDRIYVGQTTGELNAYGQLDAYGHPAIYRTEELHGLRAVRLVDQ